jgi:hypothetical protein
MEQKRRGPKQKIEWGFAYVYDAACRVLAEYSIADDDHSAEDTDALAKFIQESIEYWLKGFREAKKETGN